jgi:hypothetical protein
MTHKQVLETTEHLTTHKFWRNLILVLPNRIPKTSILMCVTWMAFLHLSPDNVFGTPLIQIFGDLSANSVFIVVFLSFSRLILGWCALRGLRYVSLLPHPYQLTQLWPPSISVTPTQTMVLEERCLAQILYWLGAAQSCHKVPFTHQTVSSSQSPLWKPRRSQRKKAGAHPEYFTGWGEGG